MSGDDPLERAAIEIFRRLLEAERDGSEAEREATLSGLEPDLRSRVEQLLSDLELLRRRRGAMGGGPADGMRLGPYRLVRRLGQGGASTVWEAVDRRLARRVAVKVLHPHLALSDRQLDRFTREARLAAGLAHPRICPVYDVGHDAGLHYLVEELVPDGRTLSDLLGERRGRVAEPEAVRAMAALVLQVCEAVAVVHARGIVHRDLKPNNILLREDDAPLVSDFGLAALIETEDLGPTSVQAGTPFYLAPEQVEGRRAVDVRSDVFSLGVTLYECLTGRRPFEGDSAQVVGSRIVELEPEPPRRLHPRLPRDLETICLVALEKDPDRRYADAGAMADDLRRFLAGEPIDARPIGRPRRLLRLARRRPGVSAAVLSGALLLAVWLLFTALLAERNRRLAGAVAAFGDAIDYMAPGREPERDAEPPAFLASMAEDGRKALAGSPRELADHLARVAEFYAQLGFFARAAELEGEAAAALESEAPASRRALELRIDELRALDYDFRTDAVIDRAPALLERAERVGGPVDVALVRLALSGAHAFEQNTAEREALDERFGPASEQVDGALARLADEDGPDAFVRRIELRRLLSRVLRAEREFEAAAAAAEAAFDACVERYGTNHYRTVLVGQQFASCLGRLRAWGIEHPRWTALGFCEYLVPIADRVLGPTSRTAVELRWRLAEAQLAVRQFERAAENYGFVVREFERWVGPENPRYLSVRVAHAIAIRETGEPARALAILEQVIPVRERVVGADHFNTLIARRARALVLSDLGREEEALTDLIGQWESFARLEGAERRDGLGPTLGVLLGRLVELGRTTEIDGWVERTSDALSGAGPEWIGEVELMGTRAHLEAAVGRGEVAAARSRLKELRAGLDRITPEARAGWERAVLSYAIVVEVLAGGTPPPFESDPAPEAAGRIRLSDAAAALLSAYGRGELRSARELLERVSLDADEGAVPFRPSRYWRRVLELLVAQVREATAGEPDARERRLLAECERLLGGTAR